VFRLAYNTNGLAHHRLLDAMRLLAELGYEGIAITPDVGVLDPFGPTEELIVDARAWAAELGLAVSIETGARYVLDARRKHFPTLMEVDERDRRRRIDFLRRCMDLGRALDAEVVSLWAGRSPEGAVADARDREQAIEVVELNWARLTSGLEELLRYGEEIGMQLAFEPEPGMFVEGPGGYAELVHRLGGAGDTLGLCLDVGHLHCTGDLPEADVIRSFGNRLLQVHLDDIRDGIHEHRMFGEGDLDLTGVLSALLEVGFDGMAAVELSRDSHRGAEAAREAMEHLRRALGGGRRG
jgi:sugar phosphate isomerase/epimerase